MSIKALAKYIDQPLVINKLQKHMPAIIVSGATVIGGIDVLRTEKSKQKEKFIKNTLVLTSTISATLLAARGLKIGQKKIFNGLMPLESSSELLKKQSAVVDNFLQKNIVGDEVLQILKKTKKNFISPAEIDVLLKKIPQNDKSNALFNTLFSPQEKLTSKGVFSEMKRLPLYGACAVGGGILGGLIADKITCTSSKKSTANKIKEGVYQYFANIFLCIVGAGSALYGLERLEKAKFIKNPSVGVKLATVIFGIVGMGMICGSLAANVIGKKVVNPLFEAQNKDNQHKRKNEDDDSIYSERKPEILDIACHIDDIGTAGIMSGFRWVEAILPALYIFSGYRAGIGYRNNGCEAAIKCKKRKAHLANHFNHWQDKKIAFNNSQYFV